MEQKIVNIGIEKEMKKAYLAYSMLAPFQSPLFERWVQSLLRET